MGSLKRTLELLPRMKCLLLLFLIRLQAIIAMNSPATMLWQSFGTYTCRFIEYLILMHVDLAMARYFMVFLVIPTAMIPRRLVRRRG